jgi:hypothetical protein
VKVDIPKNLWISSAEVDFLREGLYAGALALSLHFTGKPIESVELMSEVLDPLTKLTMPARKIVRFHGLYDKTDSSITLLIEAFKSWGYSVQAVIQVSNADVPWKDKLDWLILTTTTPFIPIASNELWYYPPDGDEIPEVRLPPNTPAVLYLAKGHSVTVTMRFVTKSKYNWNLL